MRPKDESKQEAIVDATVMLVNEIGFVAASVSKIAKRANVSPATLYIYYKNKEDLLVSTYTGIKEKLSAHILEGLDDTLPIRDILESLWFKSFRYISSFPQYFYFTEQFAYSPYSALVDKKKVDQYFEPIYKILQKGIEQKIIKDVSFEVLTVFMFYPVMLLCNPRLCANFEPNEDNIGAAFKLAWDAIKL
jgi:AcrR family transcriptional regulator